MNLAYLDCASGVSGDMLLGSLVDAGAPLDALNEAIASLGLGDCRLTTDEVRRCGFRAIQVHVRFGPDQPTRQLPEILRRIAQSNLKPRQKERAERIFQRLAEAEAQVHGIPVDQIHFHELGAVDTMADVVGTVVGFDLLGIERIVASPIPTGHGRMRIAHGMVSIPAPATAELLRGVPLAASDVEAELTTPTGAVLATMLAERFGPMPAMTVERIGRGAGGRDLAEQPNLLRLLIGTTTETDRPAEWNVEADEAHLFETNLDDVSGELVGYCVERLRLAGALDVWTTPISMKKNRPGILLSVLCRPDQAASLETIVFNETPTLGLRHQRIQRYVLRREPYEVATPWGSVQGKIRRLPDGQMRFTPEYESCRAAAERHGVPLNDVFDAASRAFDKK